jgi:hypothetical protein
VLESVPGSVSTAAEELAALGLSAQPLAGSAPVTGSTAQAAGQAAAQLGFTEIASLFLVSDRSGGAGGDAGPVLFWVFGSGLLGAAFVARRRKPLRRRRI